MFTPIPLYSKYIQLQSEGDMITTILELLLGLGVPSMKIAIALLPTLKKLGWIKTQAEYDEWARRYKEGIKQAERSSKDPVDAKKQYDNAKKDAQDKWDKEFGGK